MSCQLLDGFYRKKSMKLLLACTSGGHFATMKSLESFWSKHDRIWVCDRNIDTESLLLAEERIAWLPYQAPRNWYQLLKNIPKTYRILSESQPDLILSTGASIAINVCLMAKLLGIRFIFIESISRPDCLSVSGRFVYWMCDEFYVQWPQLCRKYRKAIFKGYAS
jgi:beta-1,4-N-acetylglucosaminyltransferase